MLPKSSEFHRSFPRESLKVPKTKQNKTTDSCAWFYPATVLFTIFNTRKRKNPRRNGRSTVFTACHFHHNYLNHLFCLEQAKEFDIKKLNCHSIQQSRTLLIGPHFRSIKLDINSIKFHL